MPMASALLYLHGVGDGDQDDRWQATLDLELRVLGYPGLSEIEIIAPKYPEGLRGVDDAESLPKVVVEASRGDEARRNRRDWQRRRTSMEALLGPDSRGVDRRGVDLIAPKVANSKPLIQARNYVKEEKIRAWVLQRILRMLPPSGRIVIVGHSLGSVIAADLVCRLPATIEVAGLITIGSPLAHPAPRVKGVEKLLKEPPRNLGWWVNFWSPWDPVPAGRGVSGLFPWILDQRIQAGAGPQRPLHNHAATTYLENHTVVTAIGFGLFGSQSKEIVPADTSVDIPTDEPESLALLAFRRAHLTCMRLQGDQRQRYSEALRLVQATTVKQMIDRLNNDHRPLPKAVNDLRVDLSDPDAATPEPRAPGHYAVQDALGPLVTVAATNVIRPFEIDLADDCEKWAMEQLTLEMGLGRRLGSDVVDALNEAHKALKGTNWVKWTALGVGAALVTLTGGLAVVAAPGVYGAAALTSALAAFGPGGMIGGLLTTGALLSAGSGSIAFGLASPGTSAEAVEAHVAGQLALAILRDKQKLEQDPETWFELAATETAMNRELARLTPISDDSSPGVKELARKLATVGRSLDYLRERGLGPQAAEIDLGDR